jgi:hypothetical protein
MRAAGGTAKNSVDQSPETGAVSLPSSTESRSSGKRGREISVAFSQLRELGEQAVVAVAASLVDGGAVLKAQLIASRFYEVLRVELRSPRWTMPNEPR